MHTPKIYIFTILTTMAALSNCGSRSSSDGGGGGGAAFSGNMQTVKGTIVSRAGSPAQLKSWVVALFEKDSSVARIAEVDANGLLTWNKVSLDSTHTAVLFSSDYLVQSVMAISSTKANTVKQYFQLSGVSLPQLVQLGAGLSFQSTTGLAIPDYYATDTDGDGNPDGVGSLSLTSTFNLTPNPMHMSLTDSDKDGVQNDTDIDIDGDGLMNGIDSDDDGDGTLDILDNDANGNTVTDSQESNSDIYFQQGIEYFTARYEQSPSANSFIFNVRVREGITPAALKIKTAPTLIDGATAIATSGTSGTWDLSLVDDGTAFDGAAADLIYGRKIQLAAGKAPRANQTIFLQMTVGTGDSAFTIDYPWTYPNISLAAITASFDATTKIITLAGNPFGDNQTFLWSATFTNSDGIKVYESSALSGGTRTLSIPANVLQSSTTYTYELVAQSLDKVPGMPALSVRSATGTAVIP